MKKLVVGVAVMALAVVGWWFWHRGHGAAPTATSESGAHAGPAFARAKAAVPAVLAGRVTNKAGGAGIAGAVVAISEAGLGAELAVDHPPIVVVADASGAFTAPQVPPGGYVVTATALGFLPGRTEKVWIASGEPKTGVVIALAGGGTVLSGTVSDIGGGPIQGANIRVRRADELDRSECVAITNRDGHYAMSLPDDTFSATALHDDYTSKSEELEIRGKPVTQDFVLAPGAVVSGVVIARDTGKPIPNAMVRATAAHDDGDFGKPNATAAADGTFTVKGLHSGVVKLTGFARGYASASPTTIEVGIAEQVGGVRVMLDRGYTISGTTVKKGSTEPLAGIKLGGFTEQGVQLAPTPSDAQGHWEIVGVRPGTFDVFASGEATVPNMAKQIQVVDKDITGVQLELEAGVTISGRVQPPRAAVLTIEPARNGPFDAMKTAMVHADADPQSGAFTLRDVPAGALKLVARTRDGLVGNHLITVAERDQRDVVVELEQRAAIAGRVIDTTGAPVAGARIMAMPRNLGTTAIGLSDIDHEVRSGDDGQFELNGLAAGTYALEAHLTDDEMLDAFATKKKLPLEIVVAATETKTGIVMTIPAHDRAIHGTVVGPDNQPAADTWVSARRVPARPPGVAAEASYDADWLPATEPVLTGADGRFAIPKLREGEYTVIAEGMRGSARAAKRANAGDTVVLELATLATLTGKVTLDGAPVASYQVSCRSAGGAETTTTGADGTYAIGHIKPAAYTCRVDADAGTATGKVTISTGPATLDFTIAPWASLAGQLVSMVDGTPVSNVAIHVVGLGTSGGANADANGRFEIAKLAPGRGEMWVMASEGYTPLGSKSYELANGQHLDLGKVLVVPPLRGDPGTFGLAARFTDVLTVIHVDPGGPAANAGIAAGDVIDTLGGKPVSAIGGSQCQFYLVAGAVAAGTTVQLGLARHATVSLTSVKR